MTAWGLSRRGLRVLLIDQSRFPREKVCGDYVEPRGLRLIGKMGCLEALESSSPLPISYSATYVNSQRAYNGRIPFYGMHHDMPPHGYIIPRETLDLALLDVAIASGVTFHDSTYVRSFSADRRGVEVQARAGKTDAVFHGRLVVGADGVNSVVARCAGVSQKDLRYMALSQRAYAERFTGTRGEAAFFFDKHLFPGYGWMFPMSEGRINCGVGILAETCRRENIHVPALFSRFLEHLRMVHPHCSKLRLYRPPIGGIVKTYGAGCTLYFQGGLLVGDAGNFADPVTGEGITPAMESALLAIPVLTAAVERGRTDAGFLSAYERAYRDYFDPSMLFLDYCAAVLRNRHFSRLWLDAAERSCRRAQTDIEFAKAIGACFGGIELHLPRVLSQVGFSVVRDLLVPFLSRGSVLQDMTQSLRLWQNAAQWVSCYWDSLLTDTGWHVGWAFDVQHKWLRVLDVLSSNTPDSRASSTLLQTVR